MILYFVIQQQRIKMSDISSYSLKKKYLVTNFPYLLQTGQKVTYNDNSLYLNPGDIKANPEQLINL